MFSDKNVVYSHTDNQQDSFRPTTKQLKESVFSGEVSNSTRVTKGKQVWYDGTMFEGSYLDGQFEGKGRLIHSTGDVYTGYFKSNQGDGEGE